MHRFLKSRTTSKAPQMEKSGPTPTLSARLDGPFIETHLPKIQIDRSAMDALLNDEPVLLDLKSRYSSGSISSHRRAPPQQSEPGDASERRQSVDSYQTSENGEAPAPPDFSGRRNQISANSRSSSHQTAHRVGPNPRPANASSESTTPESDYRSSMDSGASVETAASSINTLPALQTKAIQDDADRLDPLLEEDDPQNFDLVAAPPELTTGVYGLEKRAEQLLSSAHLEMIFSDSKQLLKFTGFLNTYRPQSMPILVFYLDALKALRAINYANAISEALEPIKGYAFTDQAPEPTKNSALQERASQAFGVLVREDLPAFIAHTWIQVVSVSIQRRVTGTLAPHLREASEGLAEVFCLSDPSRPDNPVVFASEEFHRTTQYGMNYAIGRNCRFLQGPRTDPNSVRRLAMACKNAKEHSEVFVNYRRDGSPFMNLLMVAPLFDSKGTLRYFIGAQVDVSGLLKECTDLESLAKVVDREANPELAKEGDADGQKGEFQSLSEMFNVGELETVRYCGGRMHREQVPDSDGESIASYRQPRLMLKDSTQDAFGSMSGPDSRILSSSDIPASLNGKLEGVYQHYLLVRPAPSLRILFTSPSLRVPGILQSPFLSRVGGSARVRADLAQALSEGRGVTAKIRWLTRVDANGEGEGRPRWIHATPLYGHAGTVGVWMILLVDDRESAGTGEASRRFKPAPPVSSKIGGREYDPRMTIQRREREKTRIDHLVPTVAESRQPTSHDTTGDWQGHFGTIGQRRRNSGMNSDRKPQNSSGSERAMSINSGRLGSPSELSFQLQ